MKSLYLAVVSALPFPLIFAAAPQTYPSIFVPVKAGVCIDPSNYGPTFHNFMNHFNLFALASVTSETSLYVRGPIAINGLLTASKSIVVNTNQNNAHCGTTPVVNDLGIYIRYFTGTANTMVSGRVMYQSNQNTGKVYQLDASCNSQTYQELYSNLQFSTIASYTLSIASYLWDYIDTPTHQITDDGKIKKWIHSYDERFWVFGIGICTGFTCEPTSDGLRSTGNIFSQPNWSGPSSPGYPTDRMLLFNVGVLSNTKFTATANNPSAGLDPCRAIFNIVPANYDFDRLTTGNTMFIRAGTGLFGGTILSVWLDASPLGQFAGQVVALAYDNTNSETRIGDFTDAGGDCQGRMTCWVPTNMTAPRALYTNYASTLETTIVSTRSVSTVLSSRVVATRDVTGTTTLTQFSTLTSFNIPSVTIKVPVTTTATLEFVYEKRITTTTHTPTTLGTSTTVPATSLTLTTTTTVVPTTTTTDTTTDTSFTYSLNETTTTSTTYVSTSVSNTYTLTTISTMT
ncbi:hypothetical protein MBANPS3_007160 [Mucor bainieri]